eukprot:PhM_4_TR3069/c2_g1_i8/m.91100
MRESRPWFSSHEEKFIHSATTLERRLQLRRVIACAKVKRPDRRPIELSTLSAIYDDAAHRTTKCMEALIALDQGLRTVEAEDWFGRMKADQRFSVVLTEAFCGAVEDSPEQLRRMIFKQWLRRGGRTR